MTNPRVSVLMAAYNGMPYLPEAVESIVRQTLEDWEFVIVNDGSTDGTVDYLNGLTDPRIRVVHQPNAGVAAALNRGLADCQAPYNARLDSDDVAYPRRLERQVAYLDGHPDIGLLGTQYVPLGAVRAGRPSTLATRHEDIVRRLMKANHGICHPTSMCRTSLLRQIGGYWTQGNCEDWDFFLRMAEVSRVANLDEVLLNYRFHTGSLTAERLEDMRSHIAYACDRASRRQCGDPPVTFEEYMECHRPRGLAHLAWDIDNYALAQYRKAVCDQLGGHPVRGAMRLCWASVCSPRLTGQRIVRTLRSAARRTPDS